MCHKIPYETRADAVADARTIRMAIRNSNKMRRKYAKSGRKLRPYPCPHCHKWHLTTKKKFRGKQQ